MQFKKEARGRKGGKKKEASVGQKRRDHKRKDNEKSFYTVSREAKENDEDKVHAI